MHDHDFSKALRAQPMTALCQKYKTASVMSYTNESLSDILMVQINGRRHDHDGANETGLWGHSKKAAC